MENSRDWIIFDGNLTPAGDPIVPALSRGLMYGDGVFETFRVYSGQTLFLKEHLDRLYYGCKMLGISLSLDMAHLKLLLLDLLEKNNLLTQDAVVRLQVWRDGKRGYRPQQHGQSHLLITASGCPRQFPLPKLATVLRRRIPSESLPSKAKFTNGINYILAAREAEENGADDALMQTLDGWLSETTIANIFWIKNNTFFTPSEECDLLPGITRNIVIQLLEKNKEWEINRGRFDKEHILEADAAFLCNSVREVLPVRQVDNQTLDPTDHLFKELKSSFELFRDENLKSLDADE